MGGVFGDIRIPPLLPAVVLTGGYVPTGAGMGGARLTPPQVGQQPPPLPHARGLGGGTPHACPGSQGTGTGSSTPPTAQPVAAETRQTHLTAAMGQTHGGGTPGPARGAGGEPPPNPHLPSGGRGLRRCSGRGGRGRLSRGGRGRSSPCAGAEPTAKVHSGLSPPRSPLPRYSSTAGRGGWKLGAWGCCDTSHLVGWALTTEEPLPRAGREGDHPPQGMQNPPGVPFPALGGGIARSWGADLPPPGD